MAVAIDHRYQRLFGLVLPGGNLIKNRANRIIRAVEISGLAPRQDHEVSESVALFAKRW